VNFSAWQRIAVYDGFTLVDWLGMVAHGYGEGRMKGMISGWKNPMGAVPRVIGSAGRIGIM